MSVSNLSHNFYYMAMTEHMTNRDRILKVHTLMFKLLVNSERNGHKPCTMASKDKLFKFNTNHSNRAVADINTE